MVWFDFWAMMQQWAAIGMFDIILPMLLIFAVVYAILQRSKLLGGLTGIDAIVALIIGFLAVSNPTFSAVIRPLFENVGIGLIILIVFLIFIGIFITEERETWWKKIGGVVAVAIFIWIASRFFTYYGVTFTGWWLYNVSWLIPLIFLVVVVLFIILTSKKPREETWADWIFKKRR